MHWARLERVELIGSWERHEVKCDVVVSSMAISETIKVTVVNLLDRVAGD